MPVPDILDPLTTANFDASCETASPGWPCDAEMERLRDRFAEASDEAERRAIAEAVQARGRAITTHIPLGQWHSLQAARANVDGMFQTIVTVFWSIGKS